MADMEEPTPLQQHPDTPKIPAEPLPPIQSRFLFVDVAALRAKQLRRGARPRLGDEVPAPHKAERVAMEEVRRGPGVLRRAAREAGVDEEAEG